MHPPYKALHILDHSLPLHSGYAFRSHSILRSQLRHGWQPLALTSAKHEENWQGARSPAETIEDITYHRAGLVASPLRASGELVLMLALAKRIHVVAEKEKPDILHAHSPVLTALPALWVARRLGIPLVYEIRAFWEDAAVDHGTYRDGSWKYRLVRWLESRVSEKADQVTVLCDGLKSDLIQRGIDADKLTIIANGIDANEFRATTPDPEYAAAWQLTGKTVLGFIGSFYRYEGLDLLVDAMAQLTTCHPDLVLLLVGGGEMEKELGAHVRRLGLREKVITPGRIAHERIPGVYALIDIFAYPRRAMRLTELVTPLKPLEAMAMGKALVASDVGGHRELIQHRRTGLLFRPGDVSALAGALHTLVENPYLRRSLQSCGASWVREHHTWQHTTAPYEGVYGRAFAKRAAVTTYKTVRSFASLR